MFVRQNQQQFRNSNADVQIFYGSGAGETTTWNKPPGVSHVYIMCIGAGGAGDSAASGGGSGAVTVWYGAAQNVPDVLEILVRSSGGALSGVYINGGATLLVRGSSSTTPTAGSATAANAFAASGFYQSIAGQAGSGGTVSASSTTFLSGGGGASTVTANYGYTNKESGYFMLQPIIVGISGISYNDGGIGCGGGITGKGGPGMVLIASW